MSVTKLTSAAGIGGFSIQRENQNRLGKHSGRTYDTNENLWAPEWPKSGEGYAALSAVLQFDESLAAADRLAYCINTYRAQVGATGQNMETALSSVGLSSNHIIPPNPRYNPLPTYATTSPYLQRHNLQSNRHTLRLPLHSPPHAPIIRKRAPRTRAPPRQRSAAITHIQRQRAIHVDKPRADAERLGLEAHFAPGDDEHGVVPGWAVDYCAVGSRAVACRVVSIGHVGEGEGGVPVR